MATLSWQLTLGALVLVPALPRPRPLHGSASVRPVLRADDAQRRHGHPDDRALQRRRRPARQALRPARASRTTSTPSGPRRCATSASGSRSTARSSSSPSPLVAALATAMVYGFGGVMAVHGTLTVGSLLALTALLARLYGPLTAISNVRVDVMTALVSFERVFEILDLRPIVAEAPDARPLPVAPVRVEVDRRSTSPTPPPTRSRSPPSRASPTGTGAAAARCSTTSRFDVEPGPARGARRAERARARRRSPPSSPASTTPTRGRSGSTASTCARRPWARSTTRSGWSPRRPTSSTTRSARNLLYAAPVRDRGPARGGAAGRPGVVARRAPCPPGWTPSSATADTASPEARSSGSRSPGCCSRVPASSSSTRRPPTWTASPRRPSSGPSTRPSRTGRRSSSPTGSRRSGTPTSSSSSTAARIVERGRHAELVAAGGLYAELYRTQFAEQGEVAAR